MIFWTGWGILSILIPVLGGALMAGVGTGVGMEDPSVLVGLGVSLGGVASYFVGRWFNETRSQRQADTLLEARRMELQHLVSSGQFQFAPGYAQPRSMEEANAQAHVLYETEQAQVRKAYRNRHTAFFVPMQYFAFFPVVLGLVIAVAQLF